jgi:hypothetical protein
MQLELQNTAAVFTVTQPRLHRHTPDFDPQGVTDRNLERIAVLRTALGEPSRWAPQRGVGAGPQVEREPSRLSDPNHCCSTFR